MSTLGSVFYCHQPFTVRKQICGMVAVLVLLVVMLRVSGGVKKKKRSKSGTNLLPCLDLHSLALGTAARLLWPICSPLNKLHRGFREVI